MSISELQRKLLQIVFANRSPDSYVAGGMLVAVEGMRGTKDIDIFHSREEGSIAKTCYEIDRASLKHAGYSLRPVFEPRPGFVRAEVAGPGGSCLIDWAEDSSWRFFPVQQDPLFGWRLHRLDVATDKVLAAVGRSEARDAADLVFFHRNPLSLGALIWAAASKDPGLAPAALVDMISRQANYSPDDYRTLQLRQGIDPHELKAAWVEALCDARTLVEKLPPKNVGCFFLDGAGKVIEPDPEHPETLAHRLEASRRGCWPNIMTPTGALRD
ncbi:MAG: hypothetical protein OXI87_18390 [Albidovulum sp.]|nr:hypothetical protein [Albidovulum sp.]